MECEYIECPLAVHIGIIAPQHHDPALCHLQIPILAAHCGADVGGMMFLVYGDKGDARQGGKFQALSWPGLHSAPVRRYG